ncbi:ABC-2 family transporter protein [Lactobacillus xylocopicola]|uniref:ABC transporter permease n=1 Tax=Lactobacillus xylocopicola TaxID=2976676 RepID=A0ABN6SJG6_9LACO|nr:ABC-2 family transporter protein [Lactobacillus xylocopicola]BDR59758.1 hypothetical protein KIM322_00190 [Lactobacillus xylocopicola]
MRKKHILLSIWRQSIEQFLIYRTTSVITFALALIFLLIQLYVGNFYFEDINSVAGWTKNQYFILITFTNSATYLYNIFFIVGHENFSEAILQGDLDYSLIRPVSSYWYLVGTNIDIPSIFNFFLSVILLAKYLRIELVGINQVVLISVELIMSSITIFLINQICISVTFWINGLTALYGAVEDMISFATHPRQIFPKLVQYIFTFLIPILLVTNIPVELVFGRVSWTYLLYFWIIITILYVISILMWKYGTKKYSSAN